MMRWLMIAVVLGAFLGLGIAVIPSSISSNEQAGLLMTTAGSQPRATVSPSLWPEFQLISLGLLAGLILALPVFLLAKRRA
jgi:ABC-type enterobactin transport system permease subunit